MDIKEWTEERMDTEKILKWTLETANQAYKGNLKEMTDCIRSVMQTSIC